ncbi:MAG TPA: hypothetical protein PKA50_04330, partial [Gemmatimonadales bacterium]|nr:hypothetical protein [Gemmatimonadales bacterium]
ARPAWWVASEVASRMAQGVDTTPGTASQAFEVVCGTVPELAGLTYADLGLTGRVAAGAAAASGGR